MPANRMNRDEFYAAMAPLDETRLRKALWTVYWRGTAQVRMRIEDEFRPPEQPKVKPKNQVPDPSAILAEVTEFVELAKSGAYMAGDRRVHHTERSKWRFTFKRLVTGALAALAASEPGPAQEAIGKIVDLAIEMKSWDYFHSDDPVEAAKFVVSDAVAALWDSILRHDGVPAFTQRVPAQLIRWEQEYGWTRCGYGQVAEKETSLAEVLARLLTTPDMWRSFAESYVTALEPVRRKDASQQIWYATSSTPSYRRDERTDNLEEWHDILIERFAGTPEDEFLDRIANSPGLAGPGRDFLRAKIAERRGDTDGAAALISTCLKALPGHRGYLDFAAGLDADLPPAIRKRVDEYRTQAEKYGY
ncbi:MAG: hypothetical protein J2P25_03345 [Nocardiopsaceae bacterium]|nr:hypothetical protein [Nocardiopsaceae bacterium]